MYRIVLLAFLAVCSGHYHHRGGCHGSPCHRHPGGFQGNMEHYHEMLFNDLAQRVIEIDNKIKSSCERHSNAATKEIVEQNRYLIQTPLPDYSATDVNIKIRQRVLQISAKKGDKHYTEMRVLPTFVDAAKAAYTLDDGTLEIVFPLKPRPLAVTCDLGFSDVVTTVPLFDPLINSGGQAGPRGSFDE
ncbi:hypothetical protein ABMA28_006687 [Loxostege sticticalis]|uniref:SHSP domain-containing protein n=1 Tax=Loxostege sticticalis TaxID=481309 RepID=A0ABD0TN73_LOXSC